MLHMKELLDQILFLKYIYARGLHQYSIINSLSSSGTNCKKSTWTWMCKIRSPWSSPFGENARSPWLCSLAPQTSNYIKLFGRQGHHQTKSFSRALHSKTIFGWQTGFNRGQQGGKGPSHPFDLLLPIFSSMKLGSQDWLFRKRSISPNSNEGN